MTYFSEYTVAELREIATRMDIRHTTKTRKSELLAAIDAGLFVAHTDALVDNVMISALTSSSHQSLRREQVYRAQNGTDRLTPRQARRIKHKSNRAAR